MKQIFTVLLLIGFLGMAHAADRDANGRLTADALRTKCSENNDVQTGFCFGFIEATIESLVGEDGFVLTQPLTSGQAMRIFLADIKEHPEMESNPASVAIGVALVHHSVMAEAPKNGGH